LGNGFDAARSASAILSDKGGEPDRLQQSATLRAPASASTRNAQNAGISFIAGSPRDRTGARTHFCPDPLPLIAAVTVASRADSRNCDYDTANYTRVYR
jgi:hypothetical protein